MIDDLMQRLGVNSAQYKGGDLVVCTPIDGSEIARVHSENAEAIEARITASVGAFEQWRRVPARRVGSVV